MEDVKRNILNTGIMNLIGMVLLFLIAFFLLKGIELNTATLSGTLLTIVIGLIPAFLWISFYYFLDRKDPEPVIMVASAFFAGIIGEASLSAFFGNIVFDLPAWTLNANAMPLAHLLFSRGFIPAITIYIVLRYMFYPSKHFNEPVDGMMYGAFIGIGYALSLAMKGVFSAGAVSLYFLVFSLLVNLALFSSLGALVGYSFGAARFDERHKQRDFLIALVIAVCVFSLYAWLSTKLQMNITTSSDFVSIVLVLGFTVVLLGIVFFLIQKSIKKGEAKELEGTKFFFDIVSIAAIVILLAAGLIVRFVIEGDKTFTSRENDISFTVPAAFSFGGQKDNIYTFTKHLENYTYPATLRVVVFDDYQPTSVLSLIKIQTDEAPMTIGDYAIDMRAYEKTVTLEQVTGKTSFLARVYEYTAQKEGEKLIVSIEVPGATYPGHLELAGKILRSFRKES
ncbi:MAG: PrsW family intramembrane metalloprotease [Spirochaetales bacterium]|nr:PrsW family intramembrane metalloprotease [Spirochaetales bacterium]